MGASVAAFASTPKPTVAAPLITQRVDDNVRVTLKGAVHPLATSANDRGPVENATPVRRMMMVLKRSAAQDKALAAAIQAMQRPGSPTYHHWLTPEQIGSQFGAAPQDIATVTSWLSSKGFAVDSVSKAHSVIEFSGTAGQVASAFRTKMHSYAWKGGTYTANASDPQIPSALAPLVAGFASMNNFPIHGAHTDSRLVQFDKTAKKWSVAADKSQNPAWAPGQSGRPKSEMTTNNTNDGQTLYAVTPYDFATIYNLKPLWDAGLDGTGQQIAIMAESDITTSDVDQFRSAFGLPATKLNIVHNGAAPGLISDQEEASIDVEWAGAVAKNATIDLIVSASTDVSAGVYLSMTYAVDNVVAPVISESYETCESALGPAGNLFHYQTWQQAAAEGITVVVSSGDSAAAGCDIDQYAIAQNGLAVNGFASTPYNVAVGGTDFDVNVSNPTPYWGTTNDPVTQASALSYIPEVPWNNSCASPEVFAAFGGGSGDTTPAQWCDDPMIMYAGQGSPSWSIRPIGGGGGASSCTTFNPANYPNRSYCVSGYPKPDWQSGVQGIPNDSVRDVPDVSFFASYLTFGSAYLYCMTDAVYVPTCNYNTGTGLEYLAAGGTSFGAPAFAGIVALVNQKTNSSQGLANYYLYSLAGAEFGSSSSPNSNQTSACNAGSSPQGGNSCVFYDVTEGTNALPCLIGSWDCVANPLGDDGMLSADYSNPGYDLVTGLGSVNVENLVNKWASVAASAESTTTTLSASTNLTSYGQAVVLSGTVAPLSGSDVPVGSVSIQGEQLNQASIPLVNGAFSQTVSGLLPGVYDITANYIGDGDFLNSNSAPVTMTIAAGKASPSLVLSATDQYSGATLPSGSNQIPYGSEFVATASVAGSSNSDALAPTGSVTFSSGGATLSTVSITSGIAVYQAAAANVGSFSITATYSGDTNYNAGSPATVAYTIVKAPVTLVVQPSSSTVSLGSSVTLSAQLTTNGHGSSPSGDVTFSLNGTSVGTATVVTATDAVTGAGAGSASLVVDSSLIPAGNNLVTATYSGNVDFQSASASGGSFVDLLGNQSTVLTMTASNTTPTADTPVTILATLTLGGAPVPYGSVSFSDNGKTIANIPVVGLSPAAGQVAGTARLVTRFSPGSHVIVGIYSGVGNLLHPTGGAAPPITVSASKQLTATSITTTSDTGTPANYDVTALVVAGGNTAPTGTVTLNEPSLDSTLGRATIDSSSVAFGPAPEIQVSSGPESSAIVTGDFNGDGIPDFAAINVNLSTQLMVYLGKGDGTFQPAAASVVTSDPTLTNPSSIVVGDFNSDGIADIIVGFNAGNSLAVMLGNGDGTFRQGTVLALPLLSGASASIPGNLVAADFNGDGILDIAFGGDNGSGTTSIEVFFGAGDGTFKPTPTILPGVGSSDPPNYVINLAAGDVNNDGNTDLVAFDAEDGTIGILLGKGDGTFQNEVTYPSGSLTGLGALVDMNKDGFLDIVAPNPADQNVAVFLNNQDGTFYNSANYSTATIFNPPEYYYPEPRSIAVGDLNHDGYPDVVIANSNIGKVSVLYGKTNGGLQAIEPLLLSTAANPYQVLVADLNNDGNSDIIVNEPQANTIGVLIDGYSWKTSFLNVPLNGGVAETQTMSATYAGDGQNDPSTSAALSLHGSGTTIPTKLDWAPATTTATFGTALPAGVFDAKVENSIAGAVIYSAQSATASNVPIEAGSSLPAAGIYTLAAAFTPSNPSDYAPSTANSPFTVAKANVSEALNASVAQTAVTLTDKVLSATSGTPTGLVNFLSGTTSLGAASLDATGTATLTTTSLPAGIYAVTANYLGDNNFNTDTSAEVSVVTGSPSIAVASGSPSITIVAGSSGTDTLTVSPQFGFTGNVALLCANLPAGVTCTFNPQTGAVGAGSFQSTVTLSTLAPTASAVAGNTHTQAVAVSFAAVGFGSLILILLPGRRKRLTWMTLILVTAASAFTFGCGSSKKTTTTTTGPQADTISLSSSSIKAASGSWTTLKASLSGTNAASATGSVTFYDGAAILGKANLNNGSASLTLNTLSVGIHTITAGYPGDSLNLTSSTQTALQQAITGQTSFNVIASSGAVSQTTAVSLTLQ
jgi:subtilase family serine protease